MITLFDNIERELIIAKEKDPETLLNCVIFNYGTVIQKMTVIHYTCMHEWIKNGWWVRKRSTLSTKPGFERRGLSSTIHPSGSWKRDELPSCRELERWDSLGTTASSKFLLLQAMEWYSGFGMLTAVYWSVCNKN